MTIKIPVKNTPYIESGGNWSYKEFTYMGAKYWLFKSHGNVNNKWSIIGADFEKYNRHIITKSYKTRKEALIELEQLVNK